MKKKVLVTGANKGIGFGIVEFLGKAGWEVLLGARDAQRAQKAMNTLCEQGIRVIDWIRIDLNDLKGLEESVRKLKEEHPDVNLLVNNAGIPGNMAVPSYETEIKDLRETIEVNYIGTFYLTKLMIPLLAQNKGRIVNITVPHEISPYWHPMAYVASKAAQNTMTSIMAFEFEKNNVPIEIYDIHPGPTTTDLNGNMTLPGFHTPDVVGEKVAEIIEDGKSHQGEFIELYPIVEE